MQLSLWGQPPSWSATKQTQTNSEPVNLLPWLEYCACMVHTYSVAECIAYWSIILLSEVKDGRIWVWRHQAEKLADRPLQEPAPYRGFSIMIWVVISMGEKESGRGESAGITDFHCIIWMNPEWGSISARNQAASCHPLVFCRQASLLSFRMTMPCNTFSGLLPRS